MDSVSGSTSSAMTAEAPSKSISKPPYLTDSAELGLIVPQGFPTLPENWVSFWQREPARKNGPPLFQLEHKKQSGGHRSLFIIHGLGEHCGRYQHFPSFLQNSIDRIMTYDQMGHGRSSGIRGHIEHFDNFVDDAAAVLKNWIQALKKELNREPEVHLFCHSMGGLVGLRLLNQYPELPLRSAIVSAPLLKVKVELPWAKKAAAHLLSQLWGSLQMTNEVSPQWISHDPAVVKAYQEDRLVHGKATPRFYTQMLEAIDATLENSKGFKVPLLFLVPSDDRLVDSSASEPFARKLRPPGEVIRYEGFFHEAFNEGDPHRSEINKQRVFKDVEQWIIKHHLSV